jgi:SH3-like domain-containing protein
MNTLNTPNRRSPFLSRCLLACSALVLLTTTSVYAETVSVLKDGANVRTGPSTDDQVAMELFQGYPLKVVEKKGDWLKVSDYENDTGWINKSLIGPGNTVIVNAKTTINMRSEPKTSGAIVANIERGVVLTKISTQGDWVKVKHAKGTEGWISKTLLWP